VARDSAFCLPSSEPGQPVCVGIDRMHVCQRCSGAARKLVVRRFGEDRHTHRWSLLLSTSSAVQAVKRWPRFATFPIHTSLTHEKVSGWQSLKGYATYKGHTLNPEFIQRLVKKEGGVSLIVNLWPAFPLNPPQFKLVAKHFIPPIAVNALLGTVLWASYTEAQSAFSPYLGDHPTLHAAASGAVAGGAQAIIAAPAENVRLVIEGGTGDGWSHAWKEVFRGTEPIRHVSRAEELNEARQIRDWMRDVRDMAGRGWDGWGFGIIKDVCGTASACPHHYVS